MNLIRESLSGYKTYLVCIATISFTALGMYLGRIDFTTGWYTIFGALGAAGFRSAIAKIPPQITEGVSHALISQNTLPEVTPAIPTTVTVQTPNGTHIFTVPETDSAASTAVPQVPSVFGLPPVPNTPQETPTV